MRRRHALLAALVAGCLCVLPQAAGAQLPPVKHLFIIALENENADSTFGPNTKAPYLARTLTKQGQYIPNYYAVTHLSLGNYIALVSGQGSNPSSQADCQFFTNLLPGAIGPDGQALGQGCVFPAGVSTIANQLADKGMAWKGYMEDMGNTPGEPATCRHPAIGAQDKTQSAKPNDQYAARHNPFVYFHSIIDGPDCARNDVPLDRLPADLAGRRNTATYSFITPNLCHDGHDEPCVNGEPGGLTSADAFLRKWVPMIQRSPAYREGGMIVVTFDEAESQPPGGDSSACCNQPQFPNTPNNGGPVPGPGGGRIGAVALSPFIKPNSQNATAYNHFALLRSSEDLFGLGHLGYAARPDLKAFGDDVYNAGKPRETGLKLSPARFRRRTKISYRLSQPARVEFRIDRARTGRRSASGRCVRPRRGNRRAKRCIRWTRVSGGFHRKALAGSSSLIFRGRLRGPALRPGLYRLVSAPNGWRGRGNRAKRRFRVR